MTESNPLPLAGVLLAVATLAATPALGQPRPANAPAPTPSAPAASAPVTGPDRTTAQYGDWTVACTQPGGQRVCEMNQTITDSNNQTVAALALGRPGKDQPMRLVVQVAANVRVSQPARLVMDADTTLPFTWCNRVICVVELDLRDDVIPRRFRARAADQPARLVWRDATGNEISFPVPVRGFSAAWEALGREGS